MGPEVTVRLRDASLARTLILDPELRTAEVHMDGTLAIKQGTVRDLLTLFALNRKNLRRQPLQSVIRKAYKRLRPLH